MKNIVVLQKIRLYLSVIFDFVMGIIGILFKAWAHTVPYKILYNILRTID